MHTVQHPFFLSSAKGSNRSTDGSTFTVKLDRPLKIPRDALHTRVYCNQASAIYAFPNVSAALTANVLSLFYDDHTAHGAAAVEYRLVIPEGLYANLDAVQDSGGSESNTDGPQASCQTESLDRASTEGSAGECQA